MGKQNIALFERAMKMFTPFKPEGKPAEPAPGFLDKLMLCFNMWQ